MHTDPRIRPPLSLVSTSPGVAWFTGLSGAGKSTLGAALRERLVAQGAAVAILDGDEVRSGLSAGLGFTPEDRMENIRRIAHVARLLSDQGIFVIVAAVSPLRTQRALARSIIGAAWFEVYVDTPMAVCEQRDVKGLYARARRGEIARFTGVSDAYEPPENPDLLIDTSECELAKAVDFLVLSIRTEGQAVA
ncbi:MULTISPECIES: adenylyl-sulfate kinase [unclassified Variovorax]|uniref:adenylyl-sulfate kinase n=1 Tax=unclassified Variovorax TaxID=663243 RepID=UPI001BD60F3B|nr:MULTISPECIES: adenylyl-sulfate kinase [unclassified Variovorax]